MHTRKRPGKHHVKPYHRNGKMVNTDGCWRGEGPLTGKPGRTKRVIKPRKKFDQNTDMGVHAWTVNFTYDDPKIKGETVLVFADTYDGVIDEAFDERTYKSLTPIATELIDPSLGQVIGAIGKGAKKVAGLGAKYTITGLKKAGRVGLFAGGAVAGYTGAKAVQGVKAAAKYGSYKINTRLVEQLLKDAYSDDKLRRKAARIQLKMKYPEIWDAASLSVDK